MKRPVKCKFCKRRLYYQGEPEFEREARVDLNVVDSRGNRKINVFFYAHWDCWQPVFGAWKLLLKRKK